MLRPNNVAYWKKGLKLQNFGDFLSEILFLALTRRSPLDPFGGRAKRRYEYLHLIGSVVSDSHIRIALEHAKETREPWIAFWGCGKRDETPLDPELRARCVFHGARGPLTRDALGLPADTPLGDPALLLPAIYTPRRRAELADKTICAPHLLDRKSDAELLESTGADVILRPGIAAEVEAAYAFIDQLVSARFALCGALHAAIVRCAYGLPFAYFDSGYVDVPFKWRDFAASVGVETRFAATLAEGERVYAETLAGRIALPPLEPIGRCAPFTLPRGLARRLARRETLDRPAILS